jgi:hypothetical protein
MCCRDYIKLGKGCGLRAVSSVLYISEYNWNLHLVVSGVVQTVWLQCDLKAWLVHTKYMLSGRAKSIRNVATTVYIYIYIYIRSTSQAEPDEYIFNGIPYSTPCLAFTILFYLFPVSARAVSSVYAGPLMLALYDVSPRTTIRATPWVGAVIFLCWHVIRCLT